MRPFTDSDVKKIWESFSDIDSEWCVYRLPMSPPLFAVKIYRPEFKSSPSFHTKEEAVDWLKENHPEVFKQ